MNIPVVLPTSNTKIWGKPVNRLLSYDRSYKQTANKDYCFTYIDNIVNLKHFSSII